MALVLLPVFATAQPAWLNDGLEFFEDFEGSSNPLAAADSFNSSLATSGYLDGELYSFGNGVADTENLTISFWYSNAQQVNEKAFIFAFGGECGESATFVKFLSNNDAQSSQIELAIGRECVAFSHETIQLSSKKYWNVVLTYSGRTTSIYIDGNLEGTLEVSSTIFPRRKEPIDFQLGGFPQNTRAYGYYDNIRIYNRALSATEVAQLYEYESTPPIEQWLNDGLVAYYPFDGDAKDYSGNGYDGSFYGQENFAVDENGEGFLVFDGTNGFKGNGPLTTSTPFSWSVWARLSENDDTIYMGMQSGGVEWSPNAWIKKITSDKARLHFSSFLGGPVIEEHDFILDTASWFKATFVHDSDGDRYVYINGELEASVGGASYGQVNTNFLGVNTLAGRKFYKGHAKNLRIYNRALSVTEVAQLHAFELELAPCEAIPTVVAGFVVGVGIVSQGAGYKNVPEIKFIGGNPAEEARGEAIIEDGRLIAINITNAGSGYQSEPTIRIESPPSQAQLGIGISKIETIVPESERPRRAIATANVINGFLVSADLVDGGLGYVQAPIVTVVDATGTGALAAATIENGVVTSVQFVKAGIGYSDKALIQFQSPPPNPDATPRVTEVELSMQLRFPNNYYVIEASSDLVNWEQVVEPFFAEETTHTVKVAVDDAMRYFRAIQLP